MKTVLQIEFSPGILKDREAILRGAGCRVVSVLGCDDARTIDPVAHNVGVVVIGHGAAQEERQQLVSFFREKVPDLRIICLLRYTDTPFREVDFSVPADNPALWERTVIQAAECYH